MRVGELSRRSGVSLPTIKYYLREGLLQAGKPVHRNQAEYDDDHVTRLRLVRALLDVGGLSISAVKDVLDALRDETTRLEALWEAISEHPRVVADPIAVAQAEDFVARHRAGDHSRVVPALASALAAARRLGHDRCHELLDPYLDGVRVIARADAEYARKNDHTAEDALVGLVIGNALLVAVRRFAHAEVEHELPSTAT
ncbi:MerR family transcriptional regulator [Lentzea sp. HUAS TT2]|uniref:MerR family transcriptional regulator n=1 Tax=Lentzea sp. HUAS TT2 TaxID=3447454 RepID=UPI003F72F63B